MYRALVASHSAAKKSPRYPLAMCKPTAPTARAPFGASPTSVTTSTRGCINRPTWPFAPAAAATKPSVSNAAFVLHFESGTCPSCMTREELNRFVVRVDTNNYITNPHPFAHWAAGPLRTACACDYVGNDGTAYECLCHSAFTALARLNQNLECPRHEDKIYRCPKTDCCTELVTLSGLCQHVEGGRVLWYKDVKTSLRRDGRLGEGLQCLTM